jgi:Protein of unknown function (DUF2924)
MRRILPADGVEAEIAQLSALGPKALRQRWREIVGRPAATGLRGELLRAALTHRIQERAFGGLSAPAAKRLAIHARNFEAGVRKGASAGSAQRHIKAGSRLIRAWQGQVHEVIVVPDGYLWQGSTHASLSAIARAITGTSWNGWAFFGIDMAKKRKLRDQATETERDSWPSPITFVPRTKRARGRSEQASIDGATNA